MDVFDLVAKIRLDSSDYEKGIGKAKGTMASLASGVGKGLATVAKVGAAAVSAGVAGVAALTKMGVEGYAQYEQLVGGVETLFKESQSTVMAYAENAYKTSGMSANAYMETVTSFSASLIQSLDGDTAKAAKVADMAITDMSDNANKMGTDIAMIQNAYNGFAKGNFTMLDNLKLGYGGTQEEMKRLLKDAEAISGIKYDISSFSDVTEAIHVMQEEMGIAGTTFNEAATTIEGSISMMKGAWENLVVGMADSNADMNTLINNFVESTATAAENILPRIEQTLIGIGSLIERLAPIIGEALPRLVEAVLPSLIAAGVSLIKAIVSGIIKAAPGLYNALLEAIFVALTEVFGMSEQSASTFVSTIDGLVQSLVAFFQAGFQAIAALLSWLVTQAQTEGTLFNMVWESIKTYVSTSIAVIQGVIQLFTAVLQGDWRAAWEACQNIAQTVWDAVVNIITNMVEWITGFLGTMVEKGIELINSLSEGMQNKFAEIFALVTGWITDNIVTPIVNTVSSFISAGKQLINSLKSGAVAIFGEILGQAGGWVQTNIVTPIVNKVSNFVSAGKQLINSLKKGALEIFSEILGEAGGWVDTNIISPITAKASAMLEAGKTLLNNFWNGMKSIWSSISSWWDGLTFSTKHANVNINTNGATPHATGLNYVPFDGYPAILHRGEAVLTAAEARVWRRDGLGGATPAMAGGITINQYIQSVPQTPADFANATEAYFEQARWML